ncbi:hypothetical protein LOK46_11380 [Methylobacterium sp. NMS14P]|uniref:hypothetical protein n=1 Tax=unclassified Methylobacterium TaxID=2615210 RepID=UPI0023589DC5|nr:hypothetical protein [Methylobacterium sp. NMS14P]WCS27388.1 hypothetical protein LOK46_11380 [Methylobacterium sp. NMS14P]
MPDAAIPEIRPRRRRHFGESGPDFRTSPVDLAGPPGRPSRERDGPTASPAAAPQPAGGGLGRWLLDALVISFAFGGCIHSIHPDYVDFLRDIGSRNRHAL